MDPYQILGVSRGCTREEVKKAFRARAWHAHPDRGGEGDSFIRLCNAYEQILDDLKRNPMPSFQKLAPGPRDGRPAVRPDRSWHPDFVVRDEMTGNGNPSRPPDPSWKPDLYILDEAIGNDKPPRPPDPSWKPDLYILDGGPFVDGSPNPPDPRVARRTYVSWLQQVSIQSGRTKSVWGADWVGFLGPLVLLAMMALGLWGFWIAWSYDPEQAAREAGGGQWVGDGSSRGQRGGSR